MPTKIAKAIFVFGSNEAGRHGAGSALAALQAHGAVWGKGHGLQGRSYAIPTKDRYLRTLPIESIKTYVDKFIKYATRHVEMSFVVVKIGCGLAGYSEIDIAPLFKEAPKNCTLPAGWRSY